MVIFFLVCNINNFKKLFENRAESISGTNWFLRNRLFDGKNYVAYCEPSHRIESIFVFRLFQFKFYLIFSSQKRIVNLNVDTLIELRSNYDRPDQVRELVKKLVDCDCVLKRMAIIGEMMCFRSLLQEALHDVLEERIPFLFGSIKDFHHSANSSMIDSMHIDSNNALKIVNEMASAVGIECKVDPALVNALRNQKNDLKPEDKYQYACLLMVIVAVSLPRLARNEFSIYRPELEAHANNIHCLAKAINGIAGALFTVTETNDIEDRLKEFLALASSSLMRLGQETGDKEMIRNRDSVYILLDLIVQESPFLTMDLLESCFPYALIRNTYHEVYKHISN